MKKLATAFIFAFLIAGCASKSDTAQLQDYISKIKSSLVQNDIDTTDIECVYSEEKDCIELSYKGERMTVSYDINFKDLLSENPKTEASGFIISMVVPRLQKEKTISHLELIIGNNKYTVMPFVVESLGDDYFVVGFSNAEESFRVCMELLTFSNDAIVEARLRSDIGYVRIPVSDVFNLRSMAISYKLDGGKFEKI